MHYEIVRGEGYTVYTASNDLEHSVSNFIRDGYKPQGSVSFVYIGNTVYATQAMILKENN